MPLVLGVAVLVLAACGGSSSVGDPSPAVSFVQTATVAADEGATQVAVASAEPTARPSCTSEEGLFGQTGIFGRLPNFVEVGVVTVWISAQDAVVQTSGQSNLLIIKTGVTVGSGPGSVVTLTGADIETGAPLYFQYRGEALDDLSRGSTTFTVQKPIGSNPPGFVPGAFGIETLGVYELIVAVDGEHQGQVLLVFCRSRPGP